MITQELIEKVTSLVKDEIKMTMKDTDDYGEIPDDCKDSFGEFSVITHSESEDAIWRRDLSRLFYTGLNIGIRNTLKVIKENSELISKM